MRPLHLVVLAAAPALGLAVGGWIGLAVGVVVGALAIWRPGVLIAAAVATPVVVAVVTLLEESPARETIRFFPNLRPVAHEVGLAGALVWIGVGVAFYLQSDRPALEPVDGADQEVVDARIRWPLVLMVVIAVASVLVVID